MTPAQSPITLCLASMGFFPTLGGVELRFRRYLPGLRERGVFSRVLSGTPETRKLTDSDRSEEWYRRPIGDFLPPETVEGTLVHRVRLPDREASKRAGILNRQLLGFCQQACYRPDVIQLLSKLHLSSRRYLAKLRALKIPVVFAYTSLGQWPSNPFKRIVRQMAFRALCHQLDCITASSTVTRDLLLGVGVKTRIEVISNGVDLKRFRPARDEDERTGLRVSLGIDRQAPVILFVGAIHPRKGVDLLLEAWAPLARCFPDAHLYLIGMRHDLNTPQLADFRGKVKALIQASSAVDRVHLVGFVQNVEEYLRAADLLVFPSRWEGMGNAVLEAMASALPVVLTPFLGLPPDFGQPDREYLLVDHDSGAIAAAVRRLMEHVDLRAKLGKRGRQWVQETMDVERTLDRYAELYRDLARHCRTSG